MIQIPLIILGIAIALRAAYIADIVDGLPANCGANRLRHPEFWGFPRPRK